MLKKDILIVEDEEKLRNTISDYLTLNGYTTLQAADGMEALHLLESGRERIGLVILDLMLPYLNGFELLRKIRTEGEVPVLVLTAKSSEDDQLRAFSMGADDYLMKPFLLSVLKAHMEALLRRVYNKGKRREYGRLVLEEEAHKVYLDEKCLELTPREYEVLNFLTMNEGIVLSRDRILDEVWGIDYHGTDRAVDTIIKQLRLKMKQAGSYISTIYGTGYRFEVTENEDHQG